MAQFRVKRVYAEAEDGDGMRVLVDRLWPRGLSRERAALDHWLKEIAPSHELRQEFHAGATSYEDFAARYEAELESNPAVAELRALAAGAEVVTLLYAVRDEARNHALVLKELLEMN